MTLEAAKCPSCGADIQIPSEQEKTYCAYCGNHIITSAAIAFAKVKGTGTVEVTGQVKLDTDPAVEAMLIRGRETGKLSYYRQALDVDPNCYEARLAMAKARMAGKEAKSNGYAKIVSLTGLKSMKRIIKNYQTKSLASLKKLFSADFFYLNPNDRQALLSKAFENAGRINKNQGKGNAEIALFFCLCMSCILIFPIPFVVPFLLHRYKAKCKAKPCIYAIHAYFKVLESKGNVTQEQVSLGKMLAEPLKHDAKCQTEYQRLQDYLATL